MFLRRLNLVAFALIMTIAMIAEANVKVLSRAAQNGVNLGRASQTRNILRAGLEAKLISGTQRAEIVKLLAATNSAQRSQGAQKLEQLILNLQKSNKVSSAVQAEVEQYLASVGDAVSNIEKIGASERQAYFENRLNAQVSGADSSATSDAVAQNRTATTAKKNAALTKIANARRVVLSAKREADVRLARLKQEGKISSSDTAAFDSASRDTFSGLLGILDAKTAEVKAANFSRQIDEVLGNKAVECIATWEDELTPLITNMLNITGSITKSHMTYMAAREAMISKAMSVLKVDRSEAIERVRKLIIECGMWTQKLTPPAVSTAG